MDNQELDQLEKLLVEAGIDTEKAMDLVIKAMKISLDKDISVIKALRSLADIGAPSDSMKYQLAIALQNINNVELERLKSLTAV